MKMTNEAKAKIRCEFEKAWNSDKLVDSCVKNTSGFLDLGDIIITMDKPTIARRFYFAEYGSENRSKEAAAASESVEYFIRENMRGCRAQLYLNRLNGKAGHYRHPVVYYKKYYDQPDDCRLGYVTFVNCNGELQRGDVNAPHRAMTSDEIERYREFLNAEVEKFQKRLQSYLKRYGLSKCEYSTFWADR